jgi:hypothetical protein
MQKDVITSASRAASLPTVNVPLQAPDDEAGNLAPVTAVLPRWSVTSANGAPVTPGGSLHGVMDETVITVPGPCNRGRSAIPDLVRTGMLVCGGR